MRISNILKVTVPIASLLLIGLQAGLAIYDQGKKNKHREEIEAAIKKEGVIISVIDGNNLKKN